MREGGQRITQFTNGNGSHGPEESSALGNASKRERIQKFWYSDCSRSWSKILIEDFVKDSGGRCGWKSGALAPRQTCITKPGL
jgi:hypothetical protein